MTIEAPERDPANRSLEVSPTTATSATSSIRNRRTAVRIMSGQGRPRPASAGDSTRSTSASQPRAVTIRSRVAGEKPVVRQRRIPALRRSTRQASAPGMGPHLAPVDGVVEGVLEGRVGLLGPVPVAAEQLGEHGDLGLTHGAADVVLGIGGQLTGGEADGVEGVLERLFDGAIVGHRGAGHVQGHQSDRGFHGLTSSQVCSAMAGDRVIPRPAGPVTTHTAGFDLLAVADAVIGGRRVHPGPTPDDRGQLPTEDRLGPVTEAVVGGLVHREVEGLVVDVGVADGQSAAGPLDEQELHGPLGRLRPGGRK